MGRGRGRLEQRRRLPISQWRTDYGGRGFNGTDPSPTLEEFQRYVADRQIHYFIRGKMMIGNWGGATTGSRESTDVAEWVETHYTPQTVDRVIIYDLTQPPRNS